jgi:putative toxin-antitoxin system antitoxin component (TIGR02293 family)
MSGPEPKETAQEFAGFRTMGELANELGVPQHILRYWETRFPQLKPLKRTGNQRHYRPDDVALARRIHRLLNQDGYTIRGVQQMLKSEAPEDAERDSATDPQPSSPGPVPPELLANLHARLDSEQETAEAGQSYVAEKASPYHGDNVERSPRNPAIMHAAFELVGGTDVFDASPENALDVHDLIASGIPGRALMSFIESLPGLRRSAVFEQALGMSMRTYQRRQEAPDAILSSEQGARLWKLAEILANAAALFGSLGEAENWLGEPAIGLDDRRPIDLLATPAGIGLIEEYLGRLRYGVYA